MAGLIKRGSTWHMRLVIPKRYRHIEPRKEIHKSLKTDSESQARARLYEAERRELAQLDMRLAGIEPTSDRSDFEAVTALASARGHIYQTAEELASGDINAIMTRVAKLMAEDPQAQNAEIMAADLGAVTRPTDRLSDLSKLYEESRTIQNKGKSSDQMRRWRNPLKRAADNLIDTVGDKSVLDVTRADAIALKRWYVGRVVDEEVLASTANKHIGFLKQMFRVYYEEHALDAPTMFSELKVEGGLEVRSIRLEFSDDWIVEHLLCDEPLPGLNEEATDVMLLMAETGARPSEIIGALPSHFKVSAEIPHIQLRHEGRRLKNDSSVRDIALTNRALAIVRRHPEGFLRYRDNANFANTANKYLRENRLLPSKNHSAYSLRHSYEGRAIRADIENRHRAELLGHSIKRATGREKYGDRMTLAEQLEARRRVELPISPARVNHAAI